MLLVWGISKIVKGLIHIIENCLSRNENSALLREAKEEGMLPLKFKGISRTDKWKQHHRERRNFRED